MTIIDRLFLCQFLKCVSQIADLSRFYSLQVICIGCRGEKPGNGAPNRRHDLLITAVPDPIIMFLLMLY